MTWKVKALIAGGVLILVLFLGFIIKIQYDLAQSQKAMETTVVQMKTLQDQTVRAQAKYATRDDMEKIIKASGIDMKSLQKDIDALDAKIVGVVTTSVSSSGYRGSNLVSTSTESNPETVNTKLQCEDGKQLECPNSEYLKNKQNLSINENFGSTAIPVGEVGFSAWKEKPWDLAVKPRKYNHTTVLSTNEDGRHFVHNKLIVEVDGKRYALPITNSEFTEVFPEKKFRFTPRVYMSVDGGVVMEPEPSADVAPNLQLSLFSYGKTKMDVDWTFLGVGVGYETQNESVNLMVSPVNYNVGQNLPLIDNLHLGPSISYDFEKNVGIFFGARVGL